MLTITILDNGNLKLSAGNATRQWIREESFIGYWPAMSQLFEIPSCNGSFHHFDASAGNPFVGLTSAPCIAESMSQAHDGDNIVEGRLWAFTDYATRCDLDELKNKGFVVYTLIA